MRIALVTGATRGIGREIAKELASSKMHVVLSGRDATLGETGDPGWVRTDMGGSSAPRSVQQGAKTPVWLAKLPKGARTGGFFRDEKPIDW